MTTSSDVIDDAPEAAGNTGTTATLGGEQKRSVELAVPNVELAWKLDDVFMARKRGKSRGRQAVAQRCLTIAGK